MHYVRYKRLDFRPYPILHVFPFTAKMSLSWFPIPWSSFPYYIKTSRGPLQDSGTTLWVEPGKRYQYPVCLFRITWRVLTSIISIRWKSGQIINTQKLNTKVTLTENITPDIYRSNSFPPFLMIKKWDVLSFLYTKYWLWIHSMHYRRQIDNITPVKNVIRVWRYQRGNASQAQPTEWSRCPVVALSMS
jgi:hypothetical protein